MTVAPTSNPTPAATAGASTPTPIHEFDGATPAFGPTSERTIVVLVENKAGLLARVADLFARRGYNIVSLAVAPTHDEAFSRITIVVDVAFSPLEQIVKQLFKLINVVEIAVLAPGDAVERELLLATVAAPRSARGQIVELVDIFEGKIVAVSSDALTVALDGNPAKIDDFEALLSDYEIIDLQRSGRIALPKIGRDVPRLRAL